MIAPATEQRQAAIACSLAFCYRNERNWRALGVGASLMGAVWIGAAHVASGAVLVGLSLGCQLISWSALRAARRIQSAWIDALRGL